MVKAFLKKKFAVEIAKRVKEFVDKGSEIYQGINKS
jgi:hypothetical protein